MLLSKVDGALPTPTQNARVRRALEKCVAKIEKIRSPTAVGMSPVVGRLFLGTSMASRSLFEAQQKGVAVADRVMLRAESYSVNAMTTAANADAAGVPLYQSAQALEQLTRTDKDRKKECQGNFQD
jgi:hypothetical protein